MQPVIEVIDVEEFHEHLQRKSLEDLRKKYKKLKGENRKLDTKISHLHRANDDLSRTLSEQDQRRNEIARRLGFDSIESAEASIISDDPWVSGGKAALSEAHARLLLLEDELAKHITAGEEAQTVITETKAQLDETHRHLDEALEDITRLREERDLARQEAGRQAIEANKWRNEVQMVLPEMQTLLLEQKQRNQALLASRLTALPNKENISPGRLQHNASRLHEEVFNATSLSEGHSPPSSPIITDEAQRYKQQIELLEAQYKALLETKEKISRKFCEQLVRWKKFKHWLVKEEIQGGHKISMRRRFSRRRKVMEEIGPQVVFHDASLGEVVPGTQDEAMGRPEVKPLHARSIRNDDSTTGQLHHPSTPAAPRFPAKSDLKDSHSLAPPSVIHHFAESLTQPSSVPASPHPPICAYIPDPSSLNIHLYEHGSTIPLSQQSLTQPSSIASPSPLRASRDMPDAFTKEGPPARVFAIDSPTREVAAVKREELVIKIEGTSQLNAALRRSASLSFAPDTPDRTRTPQNAAGRLLHRQKLDNVHPTSEPPPANKRRLPSPALGQGIRRTKTVLVMDTPHRTTANALLRNHSPPTDSPHLYRTGKRKRKMEETEVGECDPFQAESSRVRATAFQTRDEKLAGLKALHKKPSKGHMAEYMQFKGRGRYANVNAALGRTVNRRFEIDPDKNDGLNFQYDSVVRERDERKRLEAGDCECCRDYYEIVGPLPPRLRAPLWKSPPDINQHADRPCRHGSNGLPTKMSMSSPSARVHTKAVEDHKQSISRHRYNWAPPNTPPDFWKIEFPDTPTVKDINRRADEMHAHMFERVEAEANSRNGRYRKRT